MSVATIQQIGHNLVAGLSGCRKCDQAPCGWSMKMAPDWPAIRWSPELEGKATRHAELSSQGL